MNLFQVYLNLLLIALRLSVSNGMTTLSFNEWDKLESKLRSADDIDSCGGEIGIETRNSGSDRHCACANLVKKMAKILASNPSWKKNQPQCEPDGSFSPKQCRYKVCYCVDHQGKRRGHRIRRGRKKLQCPKEYPSTTPFYEVEDSEQDLEESSSSDKPSKKPKKSSKGSGSGSSSLTQSSAKKSKISSQSRPNKSSHKSSHKTNTSSFESLSEESVEKSVSIDSESSKEESSVKKAGELPPAFGSSTMASVSQSFLVKSSTKSLSKVLPKPSQKFSSKQTSSGLMMNESILADSQASKFQSPDHKATTSGSPPQSSTIESKSKGQSRFSTIRRWSSKEVHEIEKSEKIASKNSNSNSNSISIWNSSSSSNSNSVSNSNSDSNAHSNSNSNSKLGNSPPTKRNTPRSRASSSRAGTKKFGSKPKPHPTTPRRSSSKEPSNDNEESLPPDDSSPAESSSSPKNGPPSEDHTPSSEAPSSLASTEEPESKEEDYPVDDSEESSSVVTDLNEQDTSSSTESHMSEQATSSSTKSYANEKVTSSSTESHASEKVTSSSTKSNVSEQFASSSVGPYQGELDDLNGPSSQHGTGSSPVTQTTNSGSSSKSASVTQPPLATDPYEGFGPTQKSKLIPKVPKEPKLPEGEEVEEPLIEGVEMEEYEESNSQLLTKFSAYTSSGKPGSKEFPEKQSESNGNQNPFWGQLPADDSPFEMTTENSWENGQLPMAPMTPTYPPESSAPPFSAIPMFPTTNARNPPLFSRYPPMAFMEIPPKPMKPQTQPPVPTPLPPLTPLLPHRRRKRSGFRFLKDDELIK